MDEECSQREAAEVRAAAAMKAARQAQHKARATAEELEVQKAARQAASDKVVELERQQVSLARQAQKKGSPPVSTISEAQPPPNDKRRAHVAKSRPNPRLSSSKLRLKTVAPATANKSAKIDISAKESVRLFVCQCTIQQ